MGITDCPESNATKLSRLYFIVLAPEACQEFVKSLHTARCKLLEGQQSSGLGKDKQSKNSGFCELALSAGMWLQSRR